MEAMFGVLYYSPPVIGDAEIYTLLDYTHALNRFRTFTQNGRLPSVDPTAWREVALARDHLHRPLTNLSPKMLDNSGKDQMAIKQV